MIVFATLVGGVAVWMWLDERQEVDKPTRKTTVALAALAGLAIAKLLGQGLSVIINGIVNLVGTPAAAIVGLTVGGLLTLIGVIATLEVFIKGIWPRTANPKPWHPILALLLFGFIIGGGVPVLGGLAGWANNGVSGLVASFTTSTTGGGSTTTIGASATVCAPPGGKPGDPVAGFRDNQLAHAATIVEVGREMGAPQRAQVIAVATAMQESGLKMYANDTVPASFAIPHEAVGSDHDSVGLFQQRPSWGSLAERMDARESARLFYERLLAMKGWESMPLTVAAQNVQRSAYPNAYAKWEKAAAQVVGAVNGITCDAGAPAVNI